jgi:DNA-binding NarL/FixJ family response regulator
MNVLIVDDHHLIRDAVGAVLREIVGQDVHVFEAATAAEAFEHLANHPETELVLLDLALPDSDGLDFLEEVGARLPSIAIVVLSALQDRARIARAFELGAVGYIPKSTNRDVLQSAIKLVLAGGVYIPLEILTAAEGQDGAVAPAVDSVAKQHDELTARQTDVLRLIMQGKSNKGICRELDLAPPTVKIHVSAILKALNVRNRTEAALQGRKLGILA